MNKKIIGMLVVFKILLSSVMKTYFKVTLTLI